MAIFSQSCLYACEGNTLINSPRYVDHQNNVEHHEEVVSVPENLVAWDSVKNTHNYTQIKKENEIKEHVAIERDALEVS